MRDPARAHRGRLAAVIVAFGLLAPTMAFAFNTPFRIPVLVSSPAPDNTGILHQTVQPAAVATLLEEVAPPDGLPIKPGELLVGGMVGQGLMYCAGPQKPAPDSAGHGKAGLMAVCFRDSANAGLFDQMAVQVQEPNRARTIFEAGFSSAMHWQALRVPYRKLPLNQTPALDLDVKAGPVGPPSKARNILVEYRLCIPPPLHHVALYAECGAVRVGEHSVWDPEGMRLTSHPGEPPAKFIAGPLEIDFAMAADGSVRSTVVRPLPPGEATVRVYGEMKRGPNLLDTVFLLEPAAAGAAIQ